MDPRADDRAVSGLIGALILFGFIIILLSIYQAAFVPIENERAEFKHSQTVQNDLIELRNDLLSAETTGERAYTTIKLGVRYPVRLVAINPPPAAGTLTTSEATPVTIENGAGTPVSNICPGSGDIETRTLRYSPSYNEYESAPTIVYENTVLYLNFSGRTVLLTDQQLVQNDNVQIIPLNTSYYRFGVESTTVRAVPGNVREQDVQDANITYPTGLSEAKWEELLAGEVPAQNVTVTNGNVTIETGGQISVSCSPVGLGETPAGGQQSGEDLNINPAGPNDVTLDSVTRPGNSNTVRLELNNSADQSTSLVQARISFYFNNQEPGGKDGVGPYDISNSSETFADNFVLTGPFESLDPDPTIAANDTLELDVDFSQGANSEDIQQQDFFVIEFRFENGVTGTYFVNVPS